MYCSWFFRVTWQYFANYVDFERKYSKVKETILSITCFIFKKNNYNINIKRYVDLYSETGKNKPFKQRTICVYEHKKFLVPHIF